MKLKEENEKGEEEVLTATNMGAGNKKRGMVCVCLCMDERDKAKERQCKRNRETGNEREVERNSERYIERERESERERERQGKRQRECERETKTWYKNFKAFLLLWPLTAKSLRCIFFLIIIETFFFSFQTSITPDCSRSEFRCLTNGQCVALTDVCNQIPDCLDYTDESDCGMPSILSLGQI